MTEQSKINRKGSKRTSLFERADQMFGLDNMGPAAVPTNLPDVEPRVPRAVRDATEVSQRHAVPTEPVMPEPAQTAAPQPAVKPQERKVVLSGPHQKVDREILREEGLIVPEDQVTGLLEEFRIVKRELLADARASSDAAARRILVCSPLPGEGKTYCAINLAIALAAERDVEVVLVDADVLNPSVARRLGIDAGKGLMDTLVDDNAHPERLAIGTDIDGLFVLPAGSSSARDAEYLASARTGEVLDRLTRGAPNRFVIFDTPPALAASPAAELAAHVGQALLVVRADETSRAALEDAQQLLSACPDIKLLLNATRFSPSGRQFGDYGERE
ncbi:AAA family ATPase [uncultured Erythrobacter sp.]|uniref:AAA family ATPase n=1 Tax=uncultured Erythrobacter sp. TaxID=263913 RepID=UPI00260C4153|nr:AAA family ATPase [uncultured Erythrobacter sp.]